MSVIFKLFNNKYLKVLCNKLQNTKFLSTSKFENFGTEEITHKTQLVTFE